MISEVTGNLEAMNPEQYGLAFIFLVSYAFALGELIGPRGRRIAIGTAIAAAMGFAALSNPWEYGVMVVAIAVAGMGLFVAATWALWTLATWRDAQVGKRWHRAIETDPTLPAVRSSPFRRRLGMRST